MVSVQPRRPLGDGGHLCSSHMRTPFLEEGGQIHTSCAHRSIAPHLPLPTEDTGLHVVFIQWHGRAVLTMVQLPA